jgi:hypothetical protein
MAKAKKEEALEKKATPGAVEVYDYGEDAGSGFEGQTMADIAIPFLTVLQKMSPQCDSTTLAGAKPGMLFNTVTEELWDGEEGLVFVPAYTENVFVEWVPRDKGGGFVGVHNISSEVVTKAKSSAEEFGRYVTEEGNELQETFYVYGVLLDDEGNSSQMITIAFTSSKIRVYKKWNTKLTMFTIKGTKQRPPLFAHKVRIKTVREENPKGAYYNFVLQPANDEVRDSLLAPGSEAFLAGKKCKEMVTSGAARASYETQQGATGGGKSEGTGDIPF